jgi:hypothetical protein
MAVPLRVVGIFSIYLDIKPHAKCLVRAATGSNAWDYSDFSGKKTDVHKAHNRDLL